MLARIQFGVVSLAAVLLAGCGTKATSGRPATGRVAATDGRQSVTFHVKDMGDRLHLM
jgi:hypothetical protein